jgi:anthranilate synthase component 1
MYLIENVYPPPDADAPTVDAMYDGAIARLDNAVADLGRPLPYTPALPPDDELDRLPELRRSFEGAPWVEAVNAAKEYILDGDIFQVVLSQRFDLVEPVEPLDVYRVLRLVNPSPYMYYLHHPEATVVGSSP